MVRCELCGSWRGRPNNTLRICSDCWQTRLIKEAVAKQEYNLVRYDIKDLRCAEIKKPNFTIVLYVKDDIIAIAEKKRRLIEEERENNRQLQLRLREFRKEELEEEMEKNGIDLPLKKTPVCWRYVIKGGELDLVIKECKELLIIREEQRVREKELDDYLKSIGLEGFREDSELCRRYREGKQEQGQKGGQRSKQSGPPSKFFVGIKLKEQQFFISKTNYLEILKEVKKEMMDPKAHSKKKEEMIREEAKKIALRLYVDENYHDSGKIATDVPTSLCESAVEIYEMITPQKNEEVLRQMEEVIKDRSFGAKIEIEQESFSLST